MKKRNSLYKLANFYDAKKYLMDVTPTGPPPASRPEVERIKRRVGEGTKSTNKSTFKNHIKTKIIIRKKTY